MSIAPQPVLQYLALSLNTTAVCLAEATTQLVELLRARSDPPSPAWWRDYAASWDYFMRAHQRYLKEATAFTTHNAATLAPPSDLSLTGPMTALLAAVPSEPGGT